VHDYDDLEAGAEISREVEKDVALRVVPETKIARDTEGDTYYDSYSNCRKGYEGKIVSRSIPLFDRHVCVENGVAESEGKDDVTNIGETIVERPVIELVVQIVTSCLNRPSNDNK
jgi:hypothetical protein